MGTIQQLGVMEQLTPGEVVVVEWEVAVRVITLQVEQVVQV